MSAAAPTGVDSGAYAPFWIPTCSSRPRSRRAGPVRQILTAWTNERFELIISPSVIDGLADVLDRPKFRRFITTAIAVAFIDGHANNATILTDPPEPPNISPDPDDDYLIALAPAGEADYLVSGDRHLLDLTDPDPPVLTRRQISRPARHLTAHGARRESHRVPM
jgi:uncharacterized protein